jgi:hypothetical protein
MFERRKTWEGMGLDYIKEVYNVLLKNHIYEPILT